MLKLTMRRSLVWISVSGCDSEGQGWLMEHRAAASSVLPDVVRLARYGPRPLKHLSMEDRLGNPSIVPS
jgi:hypothetical protein